jgi:hypothetical protein
MLYAMAVAISVFAFAAVLEAGEVSAVSTIWSATTKHVAVALDKCSQEHRAAQVEARQHRGQCKDQSKKLRQIAWDAGKTISDIRKTMGQAAIKTALLKKAIAKMDRDIIELSLHLEATANAHDSNQSRREATQSRTDGQYHDSIWNLTSKIKEVQRKRDDKSATMVDVLRQRAGRWDMMQGAMKTRDVSMQKLVRLTMDCDARLAEISKKEQRLATDLQSIQNFVNVVSADVGGDVARLQSSLQQLILDVAEKRGTSQSKVLVNLETNLQAQVALLSGNIVV